jgi:hypothetical protein
MNNEFNSRSKLRLVFLTLEKIDDDVYVNYLDWNISSKHHRPSVSNGFCALENFNSRYDLDHTILVNGSPSVLEFFPYAFSMEVRGPWPTSIEDVYSILDDPMRLSHIDTKAFSPLHPMSVYLCQKDNKTAISLRNMVSIPTIFEKDQLSVSQRKHNSLFISKNNFTENIPKYFQVIPEVNFIRLWNLMFSYHDLPVMSFPAEFSVSFVSIISQDVLCSVLRLFPGLSHLPNESLLILINKDQKATYRLEATSKPTDFNPWSTLH